MVKNNHNYFVYSPAGDIAEHLNNDDSDAARTPYVTALGLSSHIDAYIPSKEKDWIATIDTTHSDMLSGEERSWIERRLRRSLGLSAVRNVATLNLRGASVDFLAAGSDLVVASPSDSEAYATDIQQRVFRPGDDFTIGRSFMADLSFPDSEYMSRVHNTGSWDGRELRLNDTSKNGSGLTLPYSTPYDIPNKHSADERNQPHHEQGRTMKLRSGSAEWTYRSRHDAIQDAHIDLPQQGLYGVLDGVGGAQYGGEAAHRMADIICHKSQIEDGLVDMSTPEAALDWLTDTANFASEALCAEYGGQGQTTLTLTKVIELNGKQYAPWVSIGDSRLYLLRDGRARQLTEDEGEGKFVTNIAGGRRNPRPVKQKGVVELRAGDRLVWTTDGVNGDYGSDIMSQPELYGHAQAYPNNPKLAARNIVDNARKRDDRTAVVVDISRS